jgi:hypothetical protein
MKTISYVAVIEEIDSDRTWKESFSDLVVDNMTILQHCEFMIKRFNATLRPGELPRKVISVRPTDKPVNRNHRWKKESLVTEKGGYDKYRCSHCGATGKRYGLAAFVTPDRKFTIYCK